MGIVLWCIHALDYVATYIGFAIVSYYATAFAKDLTMAWLVGDVDLGDVYSLITFARHYKFDITLFRIVYNYFFV